jgi:hypothetical protein
MQTQREQYATFTHSNTHNSTYSMQRIHTPADPLLCQANTLFPCVGCVWYYSINYIPAITMSPSSYSSYHQPPPLSPLVFSSMSSIQCPLFLPSPLSLPHFTVFINLQTTLTHTTATSHEPLPPLTIFPGWRRG